MYGIRGENIQEVVVNVKKEIFYEYCRYYGEYADNYEDCKNIVSSKTWGPQQYNIDSHNDAVGD